MNNLKQRLEELQNLIKKQETEQSKLQAKLEYLDVDKVKIEASFAQYGIEDPTLLPQLIAKKEVELNERISKLLSKFPKVLPSWA
jgi:predicted transcriptional regulator